MGHPFVIGRLTLSRRRSLLKESYGAVQLPLEILVGRVEIAEGEELFRVLEGYVTDGVFEVFDVHLYGFGLFDEELCGDRGHG